MSQPRLSAVYLITRDTELKKRAELELVDFPLHVLTPETFTPPTSHHHLIIVDAKDLSEADREKYRRLGPPARRIAIDDARLDNRLAKVFITRTTELHDVVTRTAAMLASSPEWQSAHQLKS